jgi:FLVCR family feline leukemia virus subgroup C receptor-related protein
MLTITSRNVLLLCLTFTGTTKVSGFAPGSTLTSLKVPSVPKYSHGKGKLSNQLLAFPLENAHSRIANTRLQSSNDDVDYSKMVPEVYDQRWTQLAYLSLLALISDWVCFSVAAAPASYETAYAGHSAASLIDIFLFTNVASCFLVTDTVKNFGLEMSIKGASALMVIGCFFRSGFGVFGGLLGALGIGATSVDPASAVQVGADLVPFWSVLAGTIMAGAAQPFFQCTPPMLSATWFASDERATSTAIALNFNQIGIAIAFLVGGEMCSTSPDGLAEYFGIISVCCAVVTMGTFMQFQNKPPTPPSS